MQSGLTSPVDSKGAALVETPAEDPLANRLLSVCHSGFPLAILPYSDIAESLGVSTDRVLQVLDGLRDCGRVRRIGPLFDLTLRGTPVLVRTRLPAQSLLPSGRVLAGMPGVGEVHVNPGSRQAWFVLLAGTQTRAARLLRGMERLLGIRARLEPVTRDYSARADGSHRSNVIDLPARYADSERKAYRPDRRAQQLLAALDQGLPVTRRPYAALGDRIAMHESEVLGRLVRLAAQGYVRRVGVEQGAPPGQSMVDSLLVWTLSPERADQLGPILAAVPGVEWARFIGGQLVVQLRGMDATAASGVAQTLATRYMLQDASPAVLTGQALAPV